MGKAEKHQPGLAVAKADVWHGNGGAALRVRFARAAAHDERGVIAFPAQAISARKASRVTGWDTERASNVVSLPRHRVSGFEISAFEMTGRSGEPRVARGEAAAQGDDDYNHRMLVNLLAAAASLLLIVTGEWIFSTLATVP
jgi:hypothetical protein